MNTNYIASILAGCSITLTTLCLFGCSPTPVSLRAEAEPMKVKKMPLTAAVVIPDSLRAEATTYDIPCAGDYVIPTGVELDNTLNGALGQLFDSVEAIPEKEKGSRSYDVIVDVTDPRFSVDGHCVTRRVLYFTGPFYFFTSPSDSYVGQGSLHTKVTARNGQVLHEADYKSTGITKDSLFASSNDRMSAAIAAMRDTMVNTVKQMAQGIAGSPQVVAYAKSFVKPVGGQKMVAAVVPSDVDEPPSSGVKPHDNRFAIVIGVENYRQGLASVEFASHDARIMREYLTRTLGFRDENVVALVNENATKSDIEKYIERWLPNRVQADSHVLVYYSGHGAPNPLTQESFLVPYDGDPTFLEITGYSLKRLYEQLGKLPSKNVVVMLDSCFSGTGERSVIAKGSRPALITLENPVMAGQNIAVLTASSGTQTSSTYHSKSHGLFTYYLLKGLQGDADGNNDKKIDLNELYAYLKPQVQGTARREYNNDQSPQLLGNPDVIKKGVLLELSK